MDEAVANTRDAGVAAELAPPVDDDDAGTPAKRSKSGASAQHAPCPVCGKFFTLRHIESHADRCAQQKFLDTTQGKSVVACAWAHAPWALLNRRSQLPPPTSPRRGLAVPRTRQMVRVGRRKREKKSRERIGATHSSATHRAPLA